MLSRMRCEPLSAPKRYFGAAGFEKRPERLAVHAVGAPHAAVADAVPLHGGRDRAEMFPVCYEIIVGENDIAIAVPVYKLVYFALDDTDGVVSDVTAFVHFVTEGAIELAAAG